MNNAWKSAVHWQHFQLFSDATIDAQVQRYPELVPNLQISTLSICSISGRSEHLIDRQVGLGDSCECVQNVNGQISPLTHKLYKLRVRTEGPKVAGDVRRHELFHLS